MTADTAASLPISTLLNRCIGFLEGFEDDPEQCVTPLLVQLRAAQQSGLITLRAPAPAPVRFLDAFDWATGGCNADGSHAFVLSRHGSHGNAGRWYWSTTRIDDDGHRWWTCGSAVMDDFGNLVEVQS